MNCRKEDKRILRLRKHLRASHPVRQAAERLLKGKETIKDIQPLLDTFAKPLAWRWRERLLAAWVLGHAQLNVQQKSAAAATLATVVEGKRADKGRMQLAVLRALFLTMLWAIADLWINRSRDDAIATLTDLLVFLPLMFLITMVFTVPVSALLEDNRAARVRAMATASLGNLGQPESVGVLAAALFDSSIRVSEVAQGAFECVLPTLSTSHYRQLPPGTITQLCRVLSKWNEELVIKVLDALGKVGDGSALLAVEPLARIRRTSRIQEEAERILPILQERQQQEVAQATLLRASDVEADGLLRASEPRAETGSDALLRASIGDEKQKR